jgi:autotransporter-associated beta strand protein
VKNGKLNVGVGKKLTVGNGGITLTDSGSSTYKTTLMIGVTDDSKFINTSGTLSLGNNIVLDVTAIGVQEAYRVIHADSGITGGGPNNAGFSEVRFNNAPVDTTAKVNLKKYVNGLEAYKTGNGVFILNHGLVWNNKGELTYTPPNPPGGAAIPLPAGSRMAHGVFDIGNGGTVTIADNLAPNTASSAWYTINTNGATGESKPLGWDTNTWDGKTLTKTGDGTLVLSGDNTYEGGTWIAQGTLRITKKEALHQSSEVNVSSGAVFELQADSASSLAFTNKVKGEGSLLKSGAGTVTLKSATSANPLTYTGETVIAAGTLKLEGAAGLENSKGKGVVIGQGAKLDITDSDYGNSLTAPFKINGLSDTNEYSRGTLALGDKALEIFQNTADASFNGQITGDGGTLIKTGDKTLLLGGDNDFSGGVYLSKGRLYAEHSNALGTGILTVNGAGTVLGLGRNGLVIENDIELTGDNDLTLYSYSDSAVLKGKISGDGGIIKTGRGSLTLQSENNYYGDTYLRAGTLRLIGDSPLGNYQGTLYVEEETNAEWKGEAALALNGSLENKIEMKGQKDLSIAVSQNEAAELSGEITGKGGIKKTEAGSLTLSGEEKKYEGVTEVTKGTLAISGTSSIESSAGVKLANMTALDIAGASSLVTIKGLTGTGEVKLGAQTLAVNKASGTDSFKGVISGTGGLVKDGAGIFALESAQKYTGDTEIKNGTLRMNGKDVLSKSETVSIAKGAVLDTGGADQAIQYLHAQEGAKLTMSAAKTLSLGGGVIEKLTAENAITNLAKVQGNTGKDTLSLKTDLTVTSFTNQKGTVNVGLGNKLNVSGTAYLQNDSTTGLAIKYDYTGGGDRQTERPANPVLTAKELKIADGAKLNITGLPQDVGQYMVIKTTGSNISGKFGEVQFNGEKAEIDKAPSLTSFHNGMKPIYKEKEIWVENGGYVWDNIADKTAHGTFFVDGDEVELNLKLNDRSGATGAFYGGWDGSTFTKTGKGTLALGGSNSYFGNTEIKDGTLKIASNGVLENTKGDVVLGGSEDTAAKAALELNYQESGTFTKAITGTGDLNKTGTGTVTVSGGTRLEGSVSVQAGTLALTGDTSFKNGTVAIKDKAILDISGVKEGEGEITFKSLFNEGTLKLGQKALVVDNALTANAAGKLSGSGTLEYKGGGTGIMSFAPGSSDFTGTARVNTGTINLAGKDALASASVDVQKGQARSNTDQTLMGLHLGDTPAPVPASESRSTASLPSLVKVGNSWQWQDSVGAAITDIPQIAIGDTSGLKTLTVNKNIGGNGTVLANAVLNAGAEFSPGNSPGTLLVDGNMTFKAGSIYKVDVDIPKSEELNSDGTLPPNYHDSLVVDGAATIEKGAKLSIGTITDLRPLGEGKSLEIKIMDAQSIQKDGNGTGGNFEIADDFLFYNPEIMFKHHISSEVRSAPASRAAGDPDATELWLVIKRSAVSIEDITKNPNENNIVDSIRSKDADDQGLLDDLNLIRKDDEDKLEEYLKDISGEIYGDLPSVAEDINRSLGGSIRGRFSNFHQYRSGFSTQLTEKDRERYMPLWVNARGVFYDHRAAYGGNAAVDVNGGDVQAGFELGLGQNRKFYLGFAAMGGLSNVEVKERESKALFTTFGGGLYGGTFFPLGPGDLVLGLGASYGLTFGHIRRDVVSGINIKYQTRDEPSQPSGQMYQASLDETLETDYRAHAIQGILDLGWDYLLTDLIGVEPYIGATWLSVITEAFQEQTTAIAHPTPAQAGLPPEDAGRLALEGQAQHNYTIASLLGARVVRHFNRKHRFDVDVNWQHIFDPARHRTKQTIRIMGKRTSPEKDPDGGWFDVEGANADIDTFNGRLGYGFNFTPRMLLKASYNAQFGYSSMSHGAELLFEYTF